MTEEWQLGIMFYSTEPEKFEAIHVIEYDDKLIVIDGECNQWSIGLNGSYEWHQIEDAVYYLFPEEPGVDFVIRILKKD